MMGSINNLIVLGSNLSKKFQSGLNVMDLQFFLLNANF
jgi:hypothetical protein